MDIDNTGRRYKKDNTISWSSRSRSNYRCIRHLQRKEEAHTNNLEPARVGLGLRLTRTPSKKNKNQHPTPPDPETFLQERLESMIEEWYKHVEI